MTHEEIAAGNTVESYVMGKLSPQESARFEEHYADCGECQDQLEAVERLRAAIRPLAAERSPANWGIAWKIAAVLLVTVGVSLYFAARNLVLRRELEQARAHSAEPAPLVASTFYLNITRGADSDAPVNRVKLSPGAPWVALSLEGDLDGEGALQGRVTDSAGATVWEQSGIPVTAHEALSVILPARALRPGDYTLTLTSHAGAAAAGRYRFRVE